MLCNASQSAGWIAFTFHTLALCTSSRPHHLSSHFFFFVCYFGITFTPSIDLCPFSNSSRGSLASVVGHVNVDSTTTSAIKIGEVTLFFSAFGRTPSPQPLVRDPRSATPLRRSTLALKPGLPGSEVFLRWTRRTGNTWHGSGSNRRKGRARDRQRRIRLTGIVFIKIFLEFGFGILKTRITVLRVHFYGSLRFTALIFGTQTLTVRYGYPYNCTVQPVLYGYGAQPYSCS